mmetsp:Transcript_27397/g.74909  ORF Transcript_27397/g.74909 Transcript_27397/m.74909 type:complete len:240 (+) Transcript_27397:179-898(+)
MARVVETLACNPTAPDRAPTIGRRATSAVCLLRPSMPQRRSPTTHSSTGSSSSRVAASANSRSGGARCCSSAADTAASASASASLSLLDSSRVTMLPNRMVEKTLSIRALRSSAFRSIDPSALRSPARISLATAQAGIFRSRSGWVSPPPPLSLPTTPSRAVGSAVFGGSSSGVFRSVRRANRWWRSSSRPDTAPYSGIAVAVGVGAAAAASSIERNLLSRSGDNPGDHISFRTRTTSP